MTYTSVALGHLDQSTLGTWHAAGIVFLVGSYVSVFPPTNLPAGWNTSQALWERILHKSDLDFLKDDLWDIPFEAIMQCYPDKTAIRSTIRRLFCQTEPNPLHRILISALQTGKSAGLVTTNYDLAFDTAIGNSTDCQIIFDKRGFDRFESLRSPSIRCPQVCFKIHGTAAPGAEETIVCDLEAEGWLSPWKRELLIEMTQGRTLVVIGYSGRDFDLCPELANSMKQAHTVWLQRHRKDLQPNAERVLRARSGTLVEGDLVKFLNLLLDEDLKLLPPTTQPIDLDGFDRTLTDEWRRQILNWIACARLLAEVVTDSNDDSALRLGLYSQTGRYRDSIEEIERGLRSSNPTGETRLRQQLQLISSKFIYGQHLRSWMMLKRLEEVLRKQPQASGDLRILAAETRMIMYMRAAQVARAIRLSVVLRRIRAMAAPLYREARKYLQECGAWGRLEALQQNAERIGIATPDGLPLPTRRGYRSLGLVSMHMITKRDWLRSGNWRLSDAKEKEALNCIAKAEQYGWNHEAWKVNWILLLRGKGNKRHYFKAWWKYFWATQYPIVSRIFQLFINLVPTGDEHQFEDDQYCK